MSSKNPLRKAADIRLQPVQLSTKSPKRRNFRGKKREAVMGQSHYGCPRAPGLEDTRHHATSVLYCTVLIRCQSNAMLSQSCLMIEIKSTGGVSPGLVDPFRQRRKFTQGILPPEDVRRIVSKVRSGSSPVTASPPRQINGQVPKILFTWLRLDTG